MTLALTKVAIIVPATVGSINQAKRQRLSQVFKEDFPLIIEPNHGVGIALANGALGDMIIVESNRIIFRREGDVVSPPAFRTWSHMCQTLFAELLLDPPPECGVHFTGLIPSTDDTMASSRQLTSLSTAVTRIVPNLLGVGLRLMLQEAGSHIGDFKFEPFIANASQYFVEITRSFKNAGDFGEVFSTAERLLSEFQNAAVTFSNLVLEEKH